jgi:tRNA G18 (ribose-2'-O)-methylase SpoU
MQRLNDKTDESHIKIKELSEQIRVSISDSKQNQGPVAELNKEISAFYDEFNKNKVVIQKIHDKMNKI